MRFAASNSQRDVKWQHRHLQKSAKRSRSRDRPLSSPSQGSSVVPEEPAGQRQTRQSQPVTSGRVDLCELALCGVAWLLSQVVSGALRASGLRIIAGVESRGACEQTRP